MHGLKNGLLIFFSLLYFNVHIFYSQCVVFGDSDPDPRSVSTLAIIIFCAGLQVQRFSTLYLVSFSLLRSWYDRKRYENPSSVARTTHYNAKGNILTFSLETYLIYFLKQTKFLTSILDTECHCWNDQYSPNRISETMSC